MRLSIFKLIFLLLSLGSISSAHADSAPPAAAASTRPNFLLIITDDQRFDTMGEFMPKTQTLIFDQGMTFPYAYATTPACCPSRSSIFTGMYARNHGVKRNGDKLKFPTMMQHLSEAGYFTGIAGKYLNSWSGTPRPEFNFWSVFSFGDSSYFDPRLNTQGVKAVRSGYLTDVLRDDALSFLTQAAAQEKPFLFVFTPFAPHAPADPAPADESAFSNLPPFQPPNFGTKYLRDKPRWIRNREQMSPERFSRMEVLRLRQLRSNLAVDRAVEQLIGRLATLGMLDNTVVLFMSDNGLLWGEHGLTSKDCVYEPAIRVPMAIRYPPLVPAGTLEQRQVANIDIAPTIYELAGLRTPSRVDGKSLVPLLNQTATSWREEILIEGWRRDLNRRPFRALHTRDAVYVESEGGEPELYDLLNDPYQIVNLANKPEFSSTVREFRQRLREKFGRDHFRNNRIVKKRRKPPTPAED